MVTGQSAATLKCLVVGTDFSVCAARALAWAVSLAKLSGARVHLVHVLLEPVQALDVAAALPYPDVEVRREWEEAARVKLDREVRAAQKRGVATTAEIRWGRPSDSIVDTAHRQKASMIVLGTHGRSALEKLLLGSTAERVLRIATLPVLTVREKRK